MAMKLRSRGSTDVAAKLFRGLGDPTRLSILLALRSGERRVADLLPVIRYHRRSDGQTQAPEGLQPAGARLARFLAHPGDDA